jgi:hypothetical protein
MLLPLPKSSRSFDGLGFAELNPLAVDEEKERLHLVQNVLSLFRR